MQKFAMFLVKHKIAASLVMTGTLATAALSSHDTHALFNAQAAVAANSLGTATLAMTTDKSTALFAVSNMVPGDSAVRTLTVNDTGSVAFVYNVKVSAGSTPTALYTDAAKGLQLEIRRGGTVYYSGSIAGLNANSAADLQIASGASDTLQFTVTLPAAADNTFQNLTENLEFQLNATQLPGTAR